MATPLRGQRAIKALAASEPCLLLPCHDPDARRRLEDRITMPTDAPTAVAVAA